MGEKRTIEIRIPKQIKIGAHSYKVSFNYHLKGMGEADAATQHEWQKVFIAPELPPSQRTVSLLHEVLHIINKIYRCGITEENIDRLSEGLAEFLIDNLQIEFDWANIKKGEE